MDGGAYFLNPVYVLLYIISQMCFCSFDYFKFLPNLYMYIILKGRRSYKTYNKKLWSLLPLSQSLVLFR